MFIRDRFAIVFVKLGGDVKPLALSPTIVSYLSCRGR